MNSEDGQRDVSLEARLNIALLALDASRTQIRAIIDSLTAPTIKEDPGGHTD